MREGGRERESWRGRVYIRDRGREGGREKVGGGGYISEKKG